MKKVRPFFTDEELSAVYHNETKDKGCKECGLFKDCISPKMPPTGFGEKRVLIIAEAPGETEDRKNIQLIGDAGKFLRKQLRELDLDLDRDFWKTNSVICRPPKNRTPKRKELVLCRPNYMSFIEEVKPEFIWLMGRAAIESFYYDRIGNDDEGASSSGLSPTRWRGLCIPDRKTLAWVLPMFHPSYALRNEDDPLTLSQFRRDLEFAASCLDYDAPVFFDVESMVVTLTRFDEVVHVLKDVLKICPEFLAFDYETTGLKPYNKGHKIASVSFCYEDDRAFSFPLQHPHWSSDQQKELIDLWSKVLQSDSKKIAHNLKYENVWSRVIVGVEPKNWESCTMNATHILDNRQRFSGLKFQALVRWGIEDYDKEIAPFLRDTDKRGLNKVLEAPLPKLLTYNAIDSLLTFWLFNEQHSEMSETEKFLDCNSFFTDSLLTLSDIEITGIPADLDYYHEVDRKLGSDLNHLEKELTEGKEARMFKEDTGKKINLKSDKDLRHLFFKLEKLPIIKETATKLPSVDIEVLLQLNSNLARNLIKYNKVDTIKNRYIAQFLREINDDGKLHPFFNLHRARTYRSASSNPNFQNIPVRDEQASSLTRNGIFPSKGRKILDWDYGALEVRIIACATLDPTLLHYCNDPSTDMHRDQAADLFALKPKEVPKKVRFYSKNCFVFPEFYGSYWRSCAPELWKNCKALEIEKGFSVEEHLAEMKIIRTKKNALDEFAKHVREVESIFWKKYEGVRDWQNETMKFYERFGYIELLTGFRCQGYMTRNELFNFPIQGPAFHCLMYSLNWINYELREKEFGTQIIGQIHDCCLFDTAPKEEKAVREMSTRIATQQIREDWKWIVVPLVLEFESTKVNGAWFSKSEEDKD